MNSLKQRGFALVIGAVLIVAALLFSAYLWIMLSWSYSTGDRAGYVQKFSKRGWVCKTWEGELAMVSMPGTMSEKFNFTVLTEETASKINQSMGKKIALVYEQHIGLPGSCFGDTQYFVTGIRTIE